MRESYVRMFICMYVTCDSLSLIFVILSTVKFSLFNDFSEQTIAFAVPEVSAFED